MTHGQSIISKNEYDRGASERVLPSDLKTPGGLILRLFLENSNPDQFAGEKYGEALRTFPARDLTTSVDLTIVTFKPECGHPLSIPLSDEGYVVHLDPDNGVPEMLSIGYFLGNVTMGDDVLAQFLAQDLEQKHPVFV